MTEELEQARGLLKAGDIPGLLRHLRGAGEALPLGELAGLVAEAARRAGFADLAQAAAMVAEDDGDIQALYAFGYACIERGACYLAVRPLARAMELAPDSAAVLSELVVALEHDGQHAHAVAVLEEHRPVMRWLHRFQYVYNALMAGALDTAAEGFRQLPEPEDAAWIPARQKVRRMLARADVVHTVTSLDRQDLRGWHYVLTGGVLQGLSPYGFDDMTGRWGYLGDSVDRCAASLQRLKLILAAAGAAPESVAMLPDRSSRILGAAAAAALSLPAADFDPARPAAHSLVVAYDLTQADPGAVAALRERAPGQILLERATCWTDPPPVTADISGLLGQSVVPPWAGQIQLLADGTVGPGPADERPIEAIAAEIGGTAPDRDEGDGTAPPDPDEVLRRLVETVAAASAGDGTWLGGIREYVPDAGPVPSSRFA